MLHVGIKRLSIPIILIRIHKRVVFGHNLMNTNKSHFFKLKRNFTKVLTLFSLATRNATCLGLRYYMLHYFKPTKILLPPSNSKRAAFNNKFTQTEVS